MGTFEIIGYENTVEYGMVLHDLVNATFRGRRIPHEWYFLEVLTRAEIKKNKELADYFVRYVTQFFPEYRWNFFKQDDNLATVVTECELKSFQFAKKYQYELPFNKTEEEYFKEAMLLGAIVTDFLIRFRNYSLIKCSGQNIILTAQSDCHKRFEKLLAEGYALQRRSKVGYLHKPEIGSKNTNGVFYKLPILPTRDIGYEIDEFIEMDDGGYEKVTYLKKSIK